MPKRVLQGVVTSAARDKTITVSVERKIAHPKYKKIVRVSKKYAAHDADNRCVVGDIVKIRECRPLSKTKSWEVVDEKQEAKS